MFNSSAPYNKIDCKKVSKTDRQFMMLHDAISGMNAFKGKIDLSN